LQLIFASNTAMLKYNKNKIIKTDFTLYFVKLIKFKLNQHTIMCGVTNLFLYNTSYTSGNLSSLFYKTNHKYILIIKQITY